MYFGESCYGVQAAAETYFGKDVSQLSLCLLYTSGMIRRGRAEMKYKISLKGRTYEVEVERGEAMIPVSYTHLAG